jgi:hypothetical protein
MDILHDETSRTISACEIKGWVGKSLKPNLSEAQCGEIAVFLTRCRWPGDPPDPPDSPWLRRLIKNAPEESWDFRAATDAAKLLMGCVPPMLSHWEGLRWAPETRGDYDAIKKLGEALSTTMPYIEWPFGHYERQTRPKRPKAWHTMALVVARRAIGVMVEAGHYDPGISRNSVVARVVRKALIRMNFSNSQMITLTAIAAHLTRWNKKFGLTPAGIAALTTK